MQLIQDIKQFRQTLAATTVHFAYMKRDGSLRDAHGTTCPDYIPPAYLPRGPRTRAQPKDTIAYWDTARGGWRSLAEERFVGMITE